MGEVADHWRQTGTQSSPARSFVQHKNPTNGRPCPHQRIIQKGRIHKSIPKSMLSENFETELMIGEIEFFTRPKKPKWRTLAEDMLALGAIAGFVILLLWLVSIGVFL